MSLTILQGDWIEKLRELPDGSVQCCVTSPPYWGLRDYGVAGQLGLEKTPEEFVAKIVAGFRELRRVLRDDGTLWLNLGDTYAANRGYQVPDQKWVDVGNSKGMKAAEIGLKPKDLIGIPWRCAFALQADGWFLRSDIIWHKLNAMPESVTDRPTKAHEYIFLLTKRQNYFYDCEAVKEPLQASTLERGYSYSDPEYTSSKMNAAEPGMVRANGTFKGKRYIPSGRNRRDVWTVPSEPFSGAHFATFPSALIRPCILAGTSAKGCCPKCGAPWERIVENNNPSKQSNTGEDMTEGAAKTSNPQTSAGMHRNGGGVYSTSKTLGWQPTCTCGETSTVPCVVLDPFGGSGTVGQVSLELGRKAILIELNPEYVKLAEDRCNVTPGLPLDA